MSGSIGCAAAHTFSVLLLAALAQSAVAQTPKEFRPLPCQDSFLSIDDSLTCSTADGRPSNDSRAIFSQHQTWENLNDVILNISMALAGHQTHFGAYGENASIDVIKGYHHVTRQRAMNWSPIKTQGNTSYMTFTADNQSCIGFDHAGPMSSAGYEWLMRGFVCLPIGQTASFEALKPYLAAMRVGRPSDNRNLFGEPVAPLRRSPNPA